MPTKPTYEIYCLYHNRVSPKYYGNQIDQITFVKMDRGPYIFKSKKHIHLIKEPWFEPIGKEWAEYEFYYSLYQGYKKGLIELPEYIGFIQYDMEFKGKEEKYKNTSIIDFVEGCFDKGLMNKDTVIAFQLYSIGEKSKKFPDIHILPLDNTSFFVEFLNKSKLTEKIFNGHGSIKSFVGSEIPMSGAYFLHKNTFIDMMVYFDDLVENNILKSYDTKIRTQGLIAELYIAFVIHNLKKLRIIDFQIKHYCIISKRKLSVEEYIIHLIGWVGRNLKLKYPKIYKILKPYFPDKK